MGRTPKPENEKVNRPIRALVTPEVMEILEGIMVESNLNLSEVIRLAIFEMLLIDGIADGETREDPTWASLRDKGYI